MMRLKVAWRMASPLRCGPLRIQQRSFFWNRLRENYNRFVAEERARRERNGVMERFENELKSLSAMMSKEYDASFDDDVILLKRKGPVVFHGKEGMVTVAFRWFLEEEYSSFSESLYFYRARTEAPQLVVYDEIFKYNPINLNVIFDKTEGPKTVIDCTARDEGIKCKADISKEALDSLIGLDSVSFSRYIIAATVNKRARHAIFGFRTRCSDEYDYRDAESKKELLRLIGTNAKTTNDGRRGDT